MIDLIGAIPVIISIIIIDGLLSVDNALAIAALASKLPKAQQQLALKVGILGAYLFRGLALAFAAYIASYPWLKLIGAMYLLYLMTSNLVVDDAEEKEEERNIKARGFIATIFAIEFMDLSLSIDNIFATVALDKRLWVVCVGVFTSILILRFFAGLCIKLIERFPVLESTAFLLIGYVGVLLTLEVVMELNHMPITISPLQKFIGIATILAFSITCDRSETIKHLSEPFVFVCHLFLKIINIPLQFIFKTISIPIHLATGLWESRTRD